MQVEDQIVLSKFIIAEQSNTQAPRKGGKVAAMPYWRLFYHAVWATQGRQPIINRDIERTVWGILRDVAGRHEIIVHAIGGVEDHVHLALSIPPQVSISSAIGKLKGASSTEINQRFDLEFKFQWQGDFAVMSFSERDLESVRRYVNRQRQHHQLGTTRPVLELARSPARR